MMQHSMNAVVPVSICISWSGAAPVSRSLPVTDVSVTWTGSRCFARVKVRAMVRSRRFWVYIGVIAVVVVALGLRYTVFDRTSEECKPVKDLLEYSRSQAENISAKTGDNEGIPTAAEETAYQAWA